MTTTQIIDALARETKWKPKTIHTLISRLVKKGALGVDKNSGQYLYYPLAEKESCIREETGSFMKKIYEGSICSMVANFIQEDKISREEIEELKRLLDDKLK